MAKKSRSYLSGVAASYKRKSTWAARDCVSYAVFGEKAPRTMFPKKGKKKNGD